ncbi:MAG: NAD(P)/FAD-dependent oxidoreductase [Bacteriovorax sp.]|nr:NAD(P)/FAD-dependent oxidoreductase [Bacteriovorax sp.]
MNKQFDVAIIGGGPAGLSGALTLARGNRTVVVFDDNQPRNAPAAHMMNFPSRDGTPPDEFRRLIREDLKKYSKVEFKSERVNDIKRNELGFMLEGKIQVKKILLAHGVTDILPEIPGIKELFGKAIFHCPYCHGYEYLNEAMGMIGGKEYADHMSVLLKGLSKDLVLFTNGAEVDQYPGIKVYTDKIDSFIYEAEKLKAVKLVTGEVVERSYLFYRPDQKLSTGLGVKLGCELTDMGHYKITDFGLTTQPDVFAAGDDMTVMQSVVFACAAGSKAGAMINFEVLQLINRK